MKFKNIHVQIRIFNLLERFKQTKDAAFVILL